MEGWPATFMMMLANIVTDVDMVAFSRKPKPADIANFLCNGQITKYQDLSFIVQKLVQEIIQKRGV